MQHSDTATGTDKRYRTGTERTRSPAASYAAYAPLCTPLGITRLANVTGLDRIGIPVFMAVRPNARSLAVSQGKGLDLDSARVSAMMEAIELWHAEHIALPLRHEAAHVLARDGAVLDISRLPRRPGAPARDDVALAWLPAVDLLHDVPVWVPFESVSMNTVIGDERQRTFAGGSNGLASGNHRLEALVHALCELIERDAVTLFHHLPAAPRAHRRLDPASVDDPHCAALLAQISAARLDVALWDVTSDLGVPTFLAALVDTVDLTSGMSRGYGAHLDAGIALARALTEAAQSRLTLIAGSRDDNPTAVYHAMQSEAATAALREFYFAPPVRRSFSAVSSTTNDFGGDLAALCERLRAAGVSQVAAVDLTQAAYGVPVVKVLAPALEGYCFDPAWHAGPRALAIAS